MQTVYLLSLPLHSTKWAVKISMGQALHRRSLHVRWEEASVKCRKRSNLHKKLSKKYVSLASIENLICKVAQWTGSRAQNLKEAKKTCRQHLSRTKKVFQIRGLMQEINTPRPIQLLVRGKNQYLQLHHTHLYQWKRISKSIHSLKEVLSLQEALRQLTIHQFRAIFKALFAQVLREWAMIGLGSLQILGVLSKTNNRLIYNICRELATAN